MVVRRVIINNDGIRTTCPVCKREHEGLGRRDVCGTRCWNRIPVPRGLRKCPNCGGVHSRNRAYCSPECESEYDARRYFARSENKSKVHVRECTECGNMFITNDPHEGCCSPECDRIVIDRIMEEKRQAYLAKKAAEKAEEEKQIALLRTNVKRQYNCSECGCTYMCIPRQNRGVCSRCELAKREREDAVRRLREYEADKKDGLVLKGVGKDYLPGIRSITIVFGEE